MHADTILCQEELADAKLAIKKRCIHFNCSLKREGPPMGEHPGAANQKGPLGPMSWRTVKKEETPILIWKTR